MKKDEYFRIFALIHHHLLPHTPVRDAVNTISQDWEADLALLSEDSDRESTDENHESSSNTGSGGGNFAPRNISIHQCGSLNTTASRHRSTASQKRRAHTRKNINIFSPHHDYFMSRKDRAREERNRIHQPHTINRMKSMSQSSEKKRNDGDDVHLSEDRSKALLPSNTSSSTANIDLDGRPINKITSGEHFNHQLNDPYRKDTEKGITLAILHRSLFQLADHWTYTNGQPVDYFRFLRDIYVQITDGRGLKRGSDISLQSNVQDEKNSPDDGQKNHENECEKNGNAKDTSDSDRGNRENRPASLSSTASQLWVKCASQTSSIFFTPIQPSTKGPVPPSPVSQLTTPPNPHSIPQGVERTNIARKSPRNGIIHISGNMKTNKRRYKYKDSSSSQDHPYFSFIRPSHLYSHIDHHHQQNKKHGRRWKAVPTAYLTEIYSRGIFSAAQYNRYCCRTENNARFAESDISNKTDHVMIIKNGTEQRNNSGKAISGKNASNVIPKKVVHLHNDTSNNNVNDGYSDNIIINCKNNNNSNNNHNHDRSSTYRKTSGDRYSRCNIRNNMIKDVIDDDEEGKEIDSDLETPQLSRQNSFNEGSDGISSKNDIRCKRNGREERAGGDNNNNIRTSRDGGDKQNAFFHKGGVLQHLDHGKNARKGTYPRDKFKNSHRSTIISSSSLTTESSSLSSFSALPSSPGIVYRKRSQRRNQRLRRRQQNIDIATILDMNPLLERMLGVEPRYTLNTCDSSDDDCNDGSESDAEHATSQMGSETTENNKNEASNIRKKDDKKREEGKVNVDTSFRVVNNNTKYTLSERAPGKIRLGVSLMKPKIHQIGTPVSIEQPPPEPPLQSTAAASMMRISSQYKSGSTSNVLSLSFPLYTASSRGANTIENRIFSSKSVVIAAVTADSQDAKVNFKDYDKEGDTNDKDSVYESRPQKEEWEQEVSEMNGQNGRGKDRRHIDNSDNKIIEDDTKDPRSVKLPLSYSPTVSSNVSSTKSITQPLIAVTAVTAPVSAAITPRGRLQSLPVRSETMSHSTTITNILKEKRRESIKRLKLYNHLMADLQDNHNAIVKVFFSENRCDTNHDENGNDIESGENIKCNFASQKEMQLQEAVVRTEGSLHGLQECDVTTTFQLLSTALSQLKASVTYSGAESAKSNAQMAKQVEVNFSLFEGFFHRPILLQSPSPVPATISLPSSFLSTQSTSHSLQLPSPSDSVEWVQRLLKLLLMDWRRQKRVLKR